MPEIPDLQAIAGFLTAQLDGRTVQSTEARYPWLVRSVGGLDSLVGHRFTAVRRTGKFLRFEIDDGRVLVVNAMITGRFTWAERAERRRPGTCITLAFSGDHELRYSDARRMGRWYLVATDALDSVPQFAELGPGCAGGRRGDVHAAAREPSRPDQEHAHEPALHRRHR
ncbi:MAG: hypothetical protein EXR65_03460 [Dehalococcoidia bacterium]|nr:hypothetical protein [Dehalococcoidia bacterium]